MREKKIEQKLVTAVNKHGGICPKFVSPHRLLRRLGFRVYVLDALEDIDKIIKEVMSNEAS